MSNAGGPKRWGAQVEWGVSKRPAFQQKTVVETKKVFDGRCDELEGHIFDCGQPKHANLYNTTMEEIINYIRLNFKEGELVVCTIMMGKEVTIKKPVKPVNNDETDLEIWRAQIKNFITML